MAARIVLAVRESHYIEPLLHYLHHSRYSELLRITAFSRDDAFAEFMRGDEVPDAIVGDARFIEAWLVEGRSKVPWALLSEDEGGAVANSRGMAGGGIIAKYQSLPSLLESILQLCEVRPSRAVVRGKDEPLLAGIVSGSGSSGKTTLALNLAKSLGSQGLSVFYLNLESVSSIGSFVRPSPGNSPGLDRLLYDLQARRDQEEIERLDFRRYVIRHEELQCDSFRPAGNLKEMLQMTQRDTQELLELLVTSRCYDIVIVDTGSIEEERVQAVLGICSLLLWVMRHDELSIHKTSRWLAHCREPHSSLPSEVLENSRVVMNLGSAYTSEEGLPEGIAVEGVLPFIPSWDLRNRGELLLNSPPYQQAVQELSRVLIEPLLPQVFTGNPQL